MSRSPWSFRLFAGLILILLGVLFLLDQFVHFDVWHYLWPFFVLGMGALFFAGMVAGGKNSAGMAIPGSIFSMIGLMLLFQNTFNVWETWSYSWTLIVLAVGIGLWIMGKWSGQEGPRRAGVVVSIVGTVLFVVFGSFFELIFHLSGMRRATWIVWPLALIAAGIYLLLRRGGAPSAARPPAVPPAPPVRPVADRAEPELPAVAPVIEPEPAMEPAGPEGDEA